MHEKHLFEYAVIRIMPRVEREEFLNVGVILYCRSKKFLKMSYQLNEVRLQTLCADLDLQQLKTYFCAIENICDGNSTFGGPIALLEMAERFRWLTASRSTIIQTSKVHPGLCDDASLTLENLYRKLVL